MTKTTPTKIKVTIADLDGYMHYVHSKAAPKKSLNEYISDLKDLSGNRIIADLSNINWPKTKIDLSYGDFSGSILDNIDFNGKNVVIKGANLRGASLKNSKFTGQIDLGKVKLGSIELRSDIFVSCQLAKAEYEPNAAKIIMLQVTKTQIDGYLALTNPKPNLNKYLEANFGHQYPGLAIVADLSNKVIDSRYNGADLSGSNLENTTITSEIANLQLRGCYTHNTIFKDCKLIEPDLRSTCLAEKGIYLSQAFRAAIFKGNIELESPKLSIGTNINLAREIGTLPAFNTPLESMSLEMDDMPILNITGNPVFDPCYNKENTDLERVYKKFSRKDVDEYCNSVHKHESGIIPSFNEFKKLKPHEVADLSELNLRDLNFSNTRFDKCDFSYSQLNRSNFDNASIKNCNFSGANFASDALVKNLMGSDSRFATFEKYARSGLKNLGIEYKTTSMVNANFSDCNFTWTNLTNVNARNATFNDITGINLEATDLKLDDGAQAHGANFSGACLDRVQASRLEAEDANFSHITCKKGNFKGAYLDCSNFSNSKFDGSDFSDSSLNASNFFKSSLKSTKLINSKMNGSRVNADISSANINASMNNSDCSSMYHNDISSPRIDHIGDPLTDHNAFKFQEMQIQQEMTKKKSNAYNKYAILLIGVTALMAIAMPITILHFVPALMTVTGAQSIINTGIVAVTALITDLTMEKVLGYSPGINKLMTNLFGVDALADLQNKRSLERIHEVSNVRNTVNNERKQLQSHEHEIIKTTQERYKQSQTQPVKESFVEKLITGKQKTNSVDLTAQNPKQRKTGHAEQVNNERSAGSNAAVKRVK